MEKTIQVLKAVWEFIRQHKIVQWVLIVTILTTVIRIIFLEIHEQNVQFVTLSVLPAIGIIALILIAIPFKSTRIAKYGSMVLLPTLINFVWRATDLAQMDCSAGLCAGRTLEYTVMSPVFVIGFIALLKYSWGSGKRALFTKRR